MNQFCELADILIANYENIAHKNELCHVQKKAVQDIISCRTAETGIHSDKCDQCGHLRFSYNSCRNRNCPKCQLTKQVVWVDKLQSNILPVRHFHLVFTIPDLLNPLIYLNQEVCYHLLFHAAMESLKKTVKHYLKVDYGAVAILHTWGQTLNYHPHIHVIVPAGGPDQDGMQWVYSNKKYLIPVKVLSAVFRGIFTSSLLSLTDQNKIKIPKDFVKNREELKTNLYKKKWVVFIEKPFKGPQQVINYLGKYVNRVAISNSRIKSFENDQVSFTYRNYRNKGSIKVMTLNATDFINRFLHHILPSGFYKIRYFGIYANVNSNRKYHCFSLLGKRAFFPELSFFTLSEVVRIVYGFDFSFCPVCKTGRMIRESFSKEYPAFRS